MALDCAMAQFDADDVPRSPAERLRDAAVGVGVVAVIAGFMGLCWWLEALQPSTASFMSAGLLLAYCVDYGLTRSKVAAWFERGRSVKAGEWRTARVVRLKVILWALFLAGYACQFALAARHAWLIGDMPRFAGATGVTVAVLAFAVSTVAWRWRADVELSITEAGIFVREWKGSVPWSAVDFVVLSRDPERAVRLVLKPQALPELPEFVRRRNGFLDLNLAAAAVSPAAVAGALRAAYPGLDVRSPRSAGVVLPVRGASDVVEADL
jgi:hypothetical protein